MVSFKDVWELRYGEKLEFSFNGLKDYLIHRSVRKYTEQKIDENLLKSLFCTAQSAATSSNLQLYSVISITEPLLRKEISECSSNQKQILTAPVFLVFLGDLYRLSRVCEQENIIPDALDYTEFTLMAAIDAALAAERLVCAAENQGLGICYIGALRNHPHKVKELLSLPDKVFPVFGLCLGWPHPDNTSGIKPRLKQRDVFFENAYSLNIDIKEYNHRMETYNTDQGRDSIQAWSILTSSRCTKEKLTGREKLLSFLQDQGLMKK